MDKPYKTAICLFFLFPIDSGAQHVNKNSRHEISKRGECWSLGIQVAPYLMGSNDLGGYMFLPDSVAIILTNLAHSNPSVQAGFFGSFEINKRWWFRADMNLMHRSVRYHVNSNLLHTFNRGGGAYAVMPTINSSLSFGRHLLGKKRLSLIGGLATQFHFLTNLGPEPTDLSRPELIVGHRVSHAVRPVTLHIQYGLQWRPSRWSVALIVQESLTSINTGFDYMGLYHPLPKLYTQSYFLTLGYAIWRSKNND